MTKKNKISPTRKTIRWIIGVVVLITLSFAIYLYHNYNQLLSDALVNSFNSNTISDVYDLKFKNLNINPVDGNIIVRNVEIVPKEKPLKNYPYINSSFHLKTRKIELIHVEIMTLLKENKLKLERIRIADPDLKFMITDKIPTFIPFNQKGPDSVSVQAKNKNFITGFFLKEFKLENASFHVLNTAKQRDITVTDFDIILNDLLMDQTPGKDVISYSKIKMNIGEISGSLKTEALKYISLKNYSLSLDQLKVEKTIDTLMYHFEDFTFGLEKLDLQTADSIFHVTLDSFNLSYKDQSIRMNGITFKPNISDNELQKRYQYQNTQFSGSIGTLSITGINFDSYIYKRTLLIDKIALDSVDAYVYKDKTKPMDLKKFPEYFGQTFRRIPFPILIKEISASKVQLTNNELKADGTLAKARLTRSSIFAANITNLSTVQPFIMKANSYLEDKAHFNAELVFDYTKPRYNMDVRFDQFNLIDLNQIIQAYTPASILSGTLDELSFSGVATENGSTGTMKFLYHDLKIDLELKDQAKWKSSVLAFAANEIVNSSNPVNGQPARIVKFSAERDRNKGFVNILIKSALSGLKETIIMSKENKKAHKAAKKQAQQKARNSKK